MAKTKKSSAKSKKDSVPKVVKPLEAPRIKLPEDDIPTTATPTIGGLIKKKIAGFWSFIVSHKGKVVILLVILAVGAWALSNYLETRDRLNKLANPKTSSQTEIQIITDQIRDAVDIPSETPTLATVSDVERLKSQLFFKNAENGDKVLIYTQACKAILYRQSTKKIIAIMSACGTDNQQSQSSTNQQPANTQPAPATTQPTQ